MLLRSQSIMFLETTETKSNALGGRLCLSLSAFSVSLRIKVYKYRLHRTLNLMSFVFVDFLIRAAARKKSARSYTEGDGRT
jgi:hypothetical protein